MADLRKKMDEPDFKEMFGFLKEMAPKKVDYLRVTESGDLATLEVDGNGPRLRRMREGGGRLEGRQAELEEQVDGLGGIPKEARSDAVRADRCGTLRDVADLRVLENAVPGLLDGRLQHRSPRVLARDVEAPERLEQTKRRPKSPVDPRRARRGLAVDGRRPPADRVDERHELVLGLALHASPEESSPGVGPLSTDVMEGSSAPGPRRSRGGKGEVADDPAVVRLAHLPRRDPEAEQAGVDAREGVLHRSEILEVRLNERPETGALHGERTAGDRPDVVDDKGGGRQARRTLPPADPVAPRRRALISSSPWRGPSRRRHSSRSP